MHLFFKHLCIKSSKVSSTNSRSLSVSWSLMLSKKTHRSVLSPRPQRTKQLKCERSMQITALRNMRVLPSCLSSGSSRAASISTSSSSAQLRQRKVAGKPPTANRSKDCSFAAAPHCTQVLGPVRKSGTRMKSGNEWKKTAHSVSHF